MPQKLREFKATIFQALAHPARIAILETLRDGERPVAVLLDVLGMEPTNLSQHCAILRTNKIVTSRKQGHQVFYSISDPHIGQVLDIMRDYYRVRVEQSVAILEEADNEAEGPRIKS